MFLTTMEMAGIPKGLAQGSNWIHQDCRYPRYVELICGEGEDLMKSLTSLGVVAIVVVGSLAMAGTGISAAETTLCKTTTEPCGSGSGYGVGTFVKATSSNAKITSAFITTSCNKSTIEGKIETATTPRIKVSAWSWSECTFPTTTVTLGELVVHHDPEALHNGTITVLGTVVRIDGPSVCYYFGEVKQGVTLRSGGSPVIVANAKVKLVDGEHDSSPFCSLEATWTGEYAVTPAPMYVTTGV
jgi:hypothetical protein